MPFKTVEQELAMRRNAPDVWRTWVMKYGHHPGYEKRIKEIAKRAAATRKKNKGKKK